MRNIEEMNKNEFNSFAKVFLEKISSCKFFGSSGQINLNQFNSSFSTDEHIEFDCLLYEKKI